jgi:hypothetical protein
MRYLVKAKVKPGNEKLLLAAIESGRLGQGSVAGDEYLDDMQKARLTEDGVCAWVEVCFCSTPLQEERAYWEEYFDLLQVKDAHARKHVLMQTEPSHGPAAIAIAHGSLNNDWSSSASLSSSR